MNHYKVGVSLLNSSPFYKILALGNKITILTSEKQELLTFFVKIEAKLWRYYYLNSGGHWTVPELFFEKKQLIPTIQQLLVTSLQHAPS